MAKIAVAASVLCSASIAVMAQDQTLKHVMTVELRNGKTNYFILDEKPVVSFNGNICSVTATSLKADYDMADIDNTHFELIDPSGVDEVTKDGLTLDLSERGIAIVRGAMPESDVTLFNIGGILITSVKADSTGFASIDLRELQGGTYLISVGKERTFKVLIH